MPERRILQASSEPAESVRGGTVPAFASGHSEAKPVRKRMITAQDTAQTLMEPSDPILNRSELEALHAKYRELKHGINNDFAVIMALGELGERNPAHLERLAKAVRERIPKVVDQFTAFGEQLSAKLKPAS